MNSLTIALLTCIPSAFTGFCFWLIERKILNQDKDRLAQEKKREKQQMLLVRGVSAAIILGTATAKAVERIPDTHCNGDMHAALDYADKIKTEQIDFLTREGIENIYEK